MNIETSFTFRTAKNEIHGFETEQEKKFGMVKKNPKKMKFLFFFRIRPNLRI